MGRFITSLLLLLCLCLSAKAQQSTGEGSFGGGSLGGDKEGKGGGQFQGPGDAAAPGTPISGPTTPAPAGGAGVVGSGRGRRSAALRGDARGNPRLAARGMSGRRSRNSGNRPLDLIPDGWERWWELNEDWMLQRAVEVTSAAPVSGRGGGFQVGRRVQSTPVRLERPDAETIRTRIVPALLELSGDDEEVEVLAEVVLALARMTDAAQGNEVARVAERLLAHSVLEVRARAALAMGVLGGRRSEVLLSGVFRADADGERAVGGSTPRDRVRSMAALALGMTGGEVALDTLFEALENPNDGDFEVTISAMIGLGLFPRSSSRWNDVRQVVEELLVDRRIDDVVRLYAASSLGAMRGREGVPSLMMALEDRRSSYLVRQACVQALGQVASVADAGVVEVLLEEVREGRDGPTRQHAIISLGQIGGRDLRPYDHAEVHQEILDQLRVDLFRDGKSQAHRGWAALAMAIYATDRPDVRSRLTADLTEAFEDEDDASFKAAFGLALGLLGDVRVLDDLREEFEERSDPSIRGYGALALGMLGDVASRPDLREVVSDASREDSLRRRAARGLGLALDTEAVLELLDGLEDSRAAGLALSLGALGDGRAVEALLAVAADEHRPALVRASACAALGRLAEKTELPWNVKLNAQYNDRAPIPALESLLGLY